MGKLITIKSYRSRPEAEIARGILEANSIKALITADDEGGLYTFPITFSGRGVEVKVMETDVDAARHLLETFEG